MAKRIVNAKGEFPLEFTANGRKYRRLTEDDGVGILRWSKMNAIASQAQLGLNVGQIFRILTEVQEGFVKALKGEVSSGAALFSSIAKLEELKKAIKGEVERDYHIGFFLACIFIVREGEDVTKFNQEEQQAKIDDWNAEDFDARDFFGMALSEASRFLGQ